MHSHTVSHGANFVVSFMYAVINYVLTGESSMEMKTEADSNDITECPHYDKPSIGRLGFLIFILLCM